MNKNILKEVVAHYIENLRPEVKREEEAYRNLKGIEEIIKQSSRCVRVEKDGEFFEKRHSHQCRIRKCCLKKAEEKLLEVREKIKSKSGSLFCELHELTNNTIGGIKGIGELTVYDIADRIKLGLGIEMDAVYLHFGTETGAQNLLCWSGDSNRIMREELPEEFNELSLSEVETLLCCYKDYPWKKKSSCS